MLINPRNHRFNGRELKVEYASLDAVRRGAAKHLVPPAPTGTKSGKKSDGKTRAPKSKALNGDTNNATGADDHDAMQVDAVHQEVKPGSAPRKERQDWRKGPKARPKPGAALALAKRETAAIVESQGRKTKF